MNDPIDDKTLQEYLGGNSPLSRHYRDLDAGDVPAHLDELVLKQSRDAVASAQPVSLEQSRLRKSRQRWVRWSVPATLAASTVLVVSIVIESGNRHQVTATTEAPAAASVAEERTRNVAPPARDELDKADAQPSTPPAPSMDKQSQKAAPSLRAQKPADTAEPAAFAPTPKESEDVAVTAKRMRASAQDSVSPAPVTVDLVPQRAIAPTIPLPASVAGDSAAEQKLAAPALRREQSAAGAADSREATDVDLQEVAVTGSRVNRPAQAVAGPRGTITQNAAVSARSDEMNVPAHWRAQPQSWLEHIRQMRKEGPADEADREWDRFRAVYPDYAVAETDSARAKK